MAVRIYSLAKELKLDSKELVELCTRAGIQDKGSALASLDDAEVARIKEFVAGKTKAPERPKATTETAAAAKAPAVMKREDYVAPTGAARQGRPKELGSKVPAPKPAPLGRAAKPSGERSGADDQGNEGSPPIQVRPGANRGPRSGNKPAPRPTFKLPPMPAAGRKPVAKTPDEPAAQKPDVKLPLDAIRSAKAGGTKPLAEHMRKHEDRQQDHGGGQRGAPRGGQRGGQRGGGLLRDGMAGGGLAPPLPPSESAGRQRKSGKGGSQRDDLLGGREMRQLHRKRHDRRGMGDDDERSMRRRRPRQRRGPSVSTAAPRKTNASVQVPCTVRAFSEAIGLAASEVLRKLLSFELDLIPNMSTALDKDTVELLAAEFEVQLDIKTAEDLEKDLLAGFDAVDEDPALQQSRAPVVTFLGHVDHGKTSLLDKILGSDVAARESGGITQHMRAYTIEHNEKPISFVDTPGHEAFTQMRARGANVTDCAVLVVAADDGIMPQTEEAISHIRAASVPIVVAINKIDLPGADIDRVFQQLAANELLPTEWGGDTEVVKTSAATGEGVDELLDTLLTIAELHDVRANPNRAAAGVCLDASIHEGQGVVACLLVQKGTLQVGDAVVCGEANGTVKSMQDTLKHRKVKQAGPSRAVMVAGFDIPPGAGERFQVVDAIALAREVATKRTDIRRQTNLLSAPVHVTFENLTERLGMQKTPTLNLIIRADVRGSIEAILKELEKLEHPEVRIRILQASVGGISEADIQLADASDAVVLGFNVVPDDRARSLAEDRGVQVRRYDIIYQVTDDLRKALEGMLAPEKQEVELGRALVQRTFSISRIGVIAGCRVVGGIISRNGRLRIIRDSRVLGDYPVDTLRREKDDAKEVRDGLECGIKVAGFNDVKEGDILECYKIEEVARTLS